MDIPDPRNLMVGLDVGSTTVKSVVVDLTNQNIVWSDYQRHDTKQPEKCLEFLKRMEADTGIKAGHTYFHHRLGRRRHCTLYRREVRAGGQCRLAGGGAPLPRVWFRHRVRRTGRQNHYLQGRP